MIESNPKTELTRQVNKRLSINLLIQGAAVDAFLTTPDQVSDELNRINRGLYRLTVVMSSILQITVWIGEIVLFLGTSKKFWRSVDDPEHPFSDHPFLRKYGYVLSKQSRRQCMKAARRRWVCTIPILHSIELYWILIRVTLKEREKHKEITDLAVQATCDKWGIDESMFDAKIALDVKIGNHQTTNISPQGITMRDHASGYSGVEHDGEKLKVVVKAWNFSVLAHELTKGVAELVCCHGLNKLDEDLYREVIHEADRIEYEIWMLQAGVALWRKFLDAKTDKYPLAETLMHLSMLEPEDLEEFLADLMEHPMTARGTVSDWFE